jgi:hypothetical protein
MNAYTARVARLRRLMKRLLVRMHNLRATGAPMAERAATYARMQRVNRAINNTVCRPWAYD